MVFYFSLSFSHLLSSLSIVVVEKKREREIVELDGWMGEVRERERESDEWCEG
jgi:hypothetical protein